MEDNCFIGLDIGTTKIACIISELDANGELKIVGVGVSPSDGLRKGVVVNIDKTVHSIQKAVEEAELMAGIDVESVYVGIAGDHIRAINSKGVVAISREDNEIAELDVVRAIDAAKAVSIPMDREILHVIPQEFIVDDQKGIKDPIGMCGVRLETQVHIITGAVTSAQNIYKSVEKAGLKVRDLVLEPLASSYAVLEKDEKELGVALVDMGGGTTDIAIYFDESIRHTAVVGLGGKNVTSDIAIGIRTPIERAEEIKKQYGCAYSPLVKATNISACRAWADGNSARSPRPCWPPSSSRGSRRYCRLPCGKSSAPNTRTCSARAWCSPAAARLWTASRNWRKRCLRCR